MTMVENIIWGANSCTLKKLIDCFPLPQLIRVEDGIYSENDAKTLSAGQVLTLHFTKRTDKVLAKPTEEKQFYIPVNCPCKVRILPTICEDIYYSVQDFVDAISVKFVRVVHDGPPTFGVKAGDILKLKTTVEENRAKFIECEFYNKTSRSQETVRLPLEFKAAFEPLDKPGEYHFQEVLSSFKLPIRVKFSSSDTAIQGVNNEVDLLSLNSVLLKEVKEESTIIATSRADGLVNVLMVPVDLDITVCPAEGAVTSDETYARLCRDFHDGADLKKVDLSLANNLRLSDEPEVEVLYDYYVEVAPPVPPRSPIRPQPDCNDSDSSDEYVAVDPLPPVPPRTSIRPQPEFDESDSSNECVNTAEPGFPAPTASREQAPDQHSQTKDKELEENEKTLNVYADYQVPHSPARSTDSTTDTNVNAGVFVHSNSPVDYRTGPSVRGEPDRGEDRGKVANDNNDDKASSYSAENKKFRRTQSTRKSWFSSIFRKSRREPSGEREGDSESSQVGCGVTTPVRSTMPSTPETLPSLPYPTSRQNSTMDFPDDLTCLSVSEVGECLRKLKMEKHADTFERSCVDGQMLQTLDEELLSCLGVSDAFERKKIIAFIRQGWRPKMD